MIALVYQRTINNPLYHINEFQYLPEPHFVYGNTFKTNIHAVLSNFTKYKFATNIFTFTSNLTNVIMTVVSLQC